MRINGSYPAPVLGVSTLAARNREKGFAEEQINFRSDPSQKLIRRPPSQWKGALLVRDEFVIGKDTHTNHSYIRDGVEYRLLVERETQGFIGRPKVYGFVDGVQVPVTGDLEEYAEQLTKTDWKMVTIEDTTYILNPDKEVKMNLNVNDSNSIERVSHINVTAALNYAETITVNITQSDATRTSVSYSVPDLGDPPDYDTADKARATAKVAEELALLINAIPDINATSLGSSVAIWETGKIDWVDVEIESGQGDRSCVAFNNTIESVNGLPLYAVVGTRITVKPNPISDKGVYYLSAERTSDIVSGETMEEVVWVQSRNPDQDYSIDRDTLPHIIEFNGTGFDVKEAEYTHRLVGDNESVKVPAFVGDTIKDVGYFQKRLVFISGNNVTMSETDELNNFWRRSALQLLATDPVSIASSATNIDKLEQLQPHNRDLLVLASNGQFKIDGTVPVTPQTISMPLTTTYECISSVRPVSIGNSVFFPIDYGNSSGIKEYTGQRETDQDLADSITNHIIGYIKGKITTLVANANLNMVAVKTDTCNHTIYVYEYKRNLQGDMIQAAWSKWELPETSEIVDLEFRKDRLTVLCFEGTSFNKKEIDMYTSAVTTPQEVYLDDRVVLNTDGLTATLPDNYVSTNIIAVRGTGTDYELELIDFTINGSTITLSEDIGAGELIVGKPYTSSYRPTRPFRYDDDGSVITDDRIRVSSYQLSVVDTNYVKMKIHSDYYNWIDQEFSSRLVGDLYNLIGEVPKYTGEVSFSFGNDPALADVEFICDNHLGCNIIDIGWRGKYFQSARRM